MALYGVQKGVPIEGPILRDHVPTLKSLLGFRVSGLGGQLELDMCTEATALASITSQ